MVRKQIEKVDEKEGLKNGKRKYNEKVGRGNGVRMKREKVEGKRTYKETGKGK